MLKRVLVLCKQELRVQCGPVRFVPLLLFSLLLSFTWIVTARLPAWESGMGLQELTFKLRHTPPVSEALAPAEIVNRLLGGLSLSGLFLAITAGLAAGLGIGTAGFLPAGRALAAAESTAGSFSFGLVTDVHYADTPPRGG